MRLTQQHAKHPRRGLKRPLPEDLFSDGTTALPSLCRRACSAKTTASHGHCRRLEQKTRLPRTATAGGLEQQDTTASHGTAGRLLSETTQRPRMTTAGRLVAGLSQRSCRRSYRGRGLTRPLAGGLASHSARAGGLTEDEASHGPCRRTCLSQRSCRRSYRRRGLTRPLAGGLVAGLSQRSCRRSYSEDEMAEKTSTVKACLTTLSRMVARPPMAKRNES